MTSTPSYLGSDISEIHGSDVQINWRGGKGLSTEPSNGWWVHFIEEKSKRTRTLTKIERIYAPIAVKLLNDGSGRHFFYLYLQNSYLSSSSRNRSPPYQNSVFQSNIFCHPNSQNFNTTLRTRYRGNSYLMYNLLVITPSWFFPIFLLFPQNMSHVDCTRGRQKFNWCISSIPCL